MEVGFDVVVDVDLSPEAPPGELVALLGEGRHGRAVEFLEQAPSSTPGSS